MAQVCINITTVYSRPSVHQCLWRREIRLMTSAHHTKSSSSRRMVAQNHTASQQTSPYRVPHTRVRQLVLIIATFAVDLPAVELETFTNLCFAKLRKGGGPSYSPYRGTR